VAWNQLTHLYEKISINYQTQIYIVVSSLGLLFFFCPHDVMIDRMVSVWYCDVDTFLYKYYQIYKGKFATEPYYFVAFAKTYRSIGSL
jgi:hypothetical protein